MSTWEEYSSTGATASQVRHLIRAVVGLHATFKDEIWLWRGQADAAHGLVPAMHTRVLRSSEPQTEATVVRATKQLIQRARIAGIDVLDGVHLPDLALLAHLQHHGAATPLLDVSVDPLVALWMVAFADRHSPHARDDRPGYVFGIRRPPKSRWIDAFDSRRFAKVSQAGPSLHWFRAPDVSERLRIQRGSFLLAGFDTSKIGLTIDVGTSTPTGWLSKRIASLGAPGRPQKRETDVVAFKVAPSLKPVLREWLDERAGLTPEVVYPTPWHRPFLDEFCKSHGRLTRLALP